MKRAMFTGAMIIGFFIFAFIFAPYGWAAEKINIPMKFVWNGKIIQPVSGNSQSWSGINGEGWWGFWNNYYYPTGVRRIIMMEYSSANYFMKSRYESVEYAAKSHGDWTLFGSSLWSDYQIELRSTISAKGEKWDVIYYSPLMNTSISNRSGYNNWHCASTTNIWNGRRKLFRITTCIVSSKKLNNKSIQNPLLARNN